MNRNVWWFVVHHVLAKGAILDDKPEATLEQKPLFKKYSAIYATPIFYRQLSRLIPLVNLNSAHAQFLFFLASLLDRQPRQYAPHPSFTRESFGTRTLGLQAGRIVDPLSPYLLKTPTRNLMSLIRKILR